MGWLFSLFNLIFKIVGYIRGEPMFKAGQDNQKVSDLEKTLEITKKAQEASQKAPQSKRKIVIYLKDHKL